MRKCQTAISKGSKKNQRKSKNPLDKTENLWYNKNVRNKGNRPDETTDSGVKEKRLLLDTPAKSLVKRTKSKNKKLQV